MDDTPNNVFKIVDAGDFVGSPIGGYYADEILAQQNFADAVSRGEEVVLYGAHHPEQLGADADPWEILDFNLPPQPRPRRSGFLFYYLCNLFPNLGV